VTGEAPVGSGTPPHRLSEASARYRLHPLLYAHALERLEQLEPETVRGARRNVRAYALAYLERYQGEVSHLERERAFLLAALAELWQQQQYSLVVRCVEGLLPLASHLGSYQDRERVLLWGIHASQQVHDQYRLAHFLYDLGLLRVCREPFAAVRRVLAESLALAEALQRPAHLLLCAIGGAIIDHNHFHVGVRAGYHRLERRNKPYFFVVGRDNDRNHWLVCCASAGYSCLHFPPEKPQIVPG
jgi:hypothetical protein